MPRSFGGPPSNDRPRGAGKPRGAAPRSAVRSSRPSAGGDDKPFRGRGGDDRPKRSFGSSEDRPERSFGASGDRAKRSFDGSDKPFRSRSSAPREGGFGARSGGDAPPRRRFGARNDNEGAGGDFGGAERSIFEPVTVKLHPQDIEILTEQAEKLNKNLPQLLQAVIRGFAQGIR